MYNIAALSSRESVVQTSTLLSPEGLPISAGILQFYRTFVAEAALMAECRHPNLVQSVAFIHDDDGKLAAFGMPRGQQDLWRELRCVVNFYPRKSPSLCIGSC